jgi:hypothetical protein
MRWERSYALFPLGRLAQLVYDVRAANRVAETTSRAATEELEDFKA